jgi:hypothetical protein
MNLAAPLIANAAAPLWNSFFDADLAPIASMPLRTTVVALIVGSIFLWLMRRTRMPSEDPEFHHDSELAPTALSLDRRPTGADRAAPRTLAKSPFSRDPTLPQLAEQIKVAAQASKRLGRTVGLIYFELTEPENNLRAQSSGTKEIEAMLNELRLQLRASDHIGVFNGKEIVVCICLLISARDLEIIGKRLLSLARSRGFIDTDPNIFAIGYAIYPQNGREGAQLISAARAHYQNQAHQQ